MLEENYGVDTPFDKDNSPGDLLKILDGAVFELDTHVEVDDILVLMNAVMGNEEWTVYNCLEAVCVTIYTQK